MKKLLVLIPIFVAAACIDIKVETNKTALADDGLDGARLTRKFYIGSDGSREEMNVWHDNQLALDCTWQPLPDGSTLCLPEHLRANTYMDASCTKPVHVEAYPTDSFACHTFQKYTRFGHDYANGCGNVSLGLTMFKVDHDKLLANGPTVSWYEKNEKKECNKKDIAGTTGMSVAMFDMTEIGGADKFVSATVGF